MRILTLSLFIFISQLVTAQYKVELLDSNTFALGEGVSLSKTSFRGLSVVDDNTIWVSGSRGTFARSIDGGKTFTYTQVKGYEKSDFRDIEAFDENHAVMMSSGTPAYILLTNDGGQTWKEAYKNTDTAYFLDAMDFWDNKRGMIVGDPIHNHFVLLQTEDGGNTWKELDATKTPVAMEGEAVFAASGTSLMCWGKNEFGFVSGGTRSYLYHLNLKNNTHTSDSIQIFQGENSQGSFSFCINKKILVIVGGDYIKDVKAIKPLNVSSCSSVDAEVSEVYYKQAIWPWIYIPYGDYKSGVDFYEKNKPIACGTKGVYIGIKKHKKLPGQKYFDTWVTISNESFNVVRKAKNGKAVFLAGGKGIIGKLIY